jgi:hypothetical protein
MDISENPPFRAIGIVYHRRDSAVCGVDEYGYIAGKRDTLNRQTLKSETVFGVKLRNDTDLTGGGYTDDASGAFDSEARWAVRQNGTVDR